MINNTKNQEIEALRGVAILFTLFHHTAGYLVLKPELYLNELYRYFNFWSGVDLFFVISGFVIFESLLRLYQTYSSDSLLTVFKKFWSRRFFRIMPSLFLWVVLFLLLTKYYNNVKAFGLFEMNIQEMKAAVLQYANLYSIDCWGEGSTKICGPYNIFWSLSLEEQFYLIMPLLFILLLKNIKYFAVACIVLQFFIFRPLWSLGWAIRSDALMWGVLIACLKPQRLQLKPKLEFLRRSSILKLALWIFILFSLAFFGGTGRDWMVSTGLIAATAALAVFLASYDSCFLIREGPIRRILNYFGSRSYSLYLIHIVAFRLSIEIFFQLMPTGYQFQEVDNLILLALGLVLMFVFSELNFRFVEGPLRKIGYRI